LGQRGGLPEALKGLSDIVLFVFQVTGSLSLWMTSQPPSYYPTEAVVHAYPGLLIALDDRTAEEFDTKCIGAWLTSAIVVEFPQALCCEYGETHFIAWRV
jgi:hypothetical protein